MSVTATGGGSNPFSASRVVPPLRTRAASSCAAAAADRSVSTRSPTTSVRPSPSRSRAVSRSCGCGLPTISAVRPLATSTAARIAPVPGQSPSGCG